MVQCDANGVGAKRAGTVAGLALGSFRAYGETRVNRVRISGSHMPSESQEA